MGKFLINMSNFSDLIAKSEAKLGPNSPLQHGPHSLLVALTAPVVQQPTPLASHAPIGFVRYIRSGAVEQPVETRYIQQSTLKKDQTAQTRSQRPQNQSLGFLQRIIYQQSLILEEILKNNVAIDRQISSLNETIKTLVDSTGQPSRTDPGSVSSRSAPAFEMGLFLSGQLRVSFKFQLVLQNVLQLPLYRQRNFSLKIKLLDIFGNLFENNNRIPLAISIYSPQNPPKQLQYNISGNRMVKGFSQQDLFRGICNFDKIQIKEVTSHFRKGWVYLVVSPKGFESGMRHIERDYVPSQAIKPLVIDKVVVKAKKIIKKSQTGEKLQASDEQ